MCAYYYPVAGQGAVYYHSTVCLAEATPVQTYSMVRNFGQMAKNYIAFSGSVIAFEFIIELEVIGKTHKPFLHFPRKSYRPGFVRVYGS
jgi:hypothetical protein